MHQVAPIFLHVRDTSMVYRMTAGLFYCKAQKKKIVPGTCKPNPKKYSACRACVFYWEELDVENLLRNRPNPLTKAEIPEWLKTEKREPCRERKYKIPPTISLDLGLKKMIDTYRSYKEESSKWEIPLTTKTLSEWERLSNARQWKALYQAQAKVLEDWFLKNPDFVVQLLKPNRSRIKMMKGLGIRYDFGLYHLTAKILIKLYGFRDDVSTAILNTIFAKIYSKIGLKVDITNQAWLHEHPYDALKVSRAGLEYTRFCRRLARQGVAVLWSAELYLLKAIKKVLKGMAKESLLPRKTRTFLDLKEEKARGDDADKEVEAILFQESTDYAERSKEWSEIDEQLSVLFHMQKLYLSLSEKEKIVLDMKLAERTRGEIAECLKRKYKKCCTKTVDRIWERILRKAGNVT